MTLSLPCHPIIIAIDGYSSCGKSVLTKKLAKILGYKAIDSGACYRAITYYFITHQIDWTNIQQCEEAIQHIDLRYGMGTETVIFLNNQPLAQELRTMDIEMNISDISKISIVRDFALHVQQQEGVNKGVVMDGRDIGTFVFPKAEIKFFLTAAIDIRAKRRWEEIKNTNPAITMEEVKNSLMNRDHIDSNRAYRPLSKAQDAIEIDNTHLSIQQELDLMLWWVEKKTIQ